MQSAAYLRSSSWKPATAASSAVVRLATTSVVHAASGARFAETKSQPVTAMSTAAEAASLYATTQPPRPLWLRAHTPPFLRTAAGGLPKAAPASEAIAASELSRIEPVNPPRKSEEVHLEIESLKYYEVLKPIPVIVRPLGERTFEAEVPELNISTTGSSIMGVFLSMKSQIVSIVDRYRGKKSLSPEEQRHLAAFEKYIGNARRHWYAR